jgi:hypothetical protein
MRPFLVTWGAYLALMLSVPTIFLARFDIPEKADFGCFYAAGVLARTDPSHLYDVSRQMQTQNALVGPENGWTVFIQPPYEALVLIPFSLLSYRAAYLLYLALNVALIIPCFFLARDAFSNVIDPWQPQPGLLFFFFLPLALAVLQGQGSVRLLLCCCAAWHELRRNRDFTAGLILALSLFKMQIAVPLFLLVVVWRGSRFLAGFVTGTGVLALLSGWLVRPSGLLDFGKLLLASSLLNRDKLPKIPSAGLLPSEMPNLRGLLYGWGGRYLPHSYMLGLTLVVSAALFLWICNLLRKERDGSTAFALAMIGSMLLSYYLHIHDLTALLLPIALMAARTRRSFSAIVSACFILPVVLVFWLGVQTHYLLAIPLIGLVAIIAGGLQGEENPVQAAAVRP